VHCAGNLGDVIFVQANDRLRPVSAVHPPQFPEDIAIVKVRLIESIELTINV
jgi:hypothetical protein